MQIKIIEDWRGAHKLLSMWVAAFWAGLLGFVASHPGFAATVWALIPAELRPDVPAWGKWLLLSFVAFSSWAAARLVKQPVRTPKGGDAGAA